jgi:heme oxygenase
MNAQQLSNERRSSGHHNGEGSAPSRCCPAAPPADALNESLAEALKAHTREAHTRAERHPIQARMVKGSVTVAQYAAYLNQMLHVWREFDADLAALARRDARVAAMMKPYHPHADRIVADLSFLGQCAADHSPLPATARFVETVSHWAAVASPNLIGVWYVLEGSANGGQFIAKTIARALGIAGPDGLMSLDPHGQAQRERWRSWRESLDAQEFSKVERIGIVSAANATFSAMCDLMDDLHDEGAPPSAPLVEPIAHGSRRVLHA